MSYDFRLTIGWLRNGNPFMKTYLLETIINGHVRRATAMHTRILVGLSSDIEQGNRF